MGSYGRAYGVELPQSGAEMRNAPHLEIYESDKNPMDPDYEMIIAIPVQ
jgi:predicted transcriptional regulator YdeE